MNDILTLTRRFKSYFVYYLENILISNISNYLYFTIFLSVMLSPEIGKPSERTCRESYHWKIPGHKPKSIHNFT